MTRNPAFMTASQPLFTQVRDFGTTCRLWKDWPYAGRYHYRACHITDAQYCDLNKLIYVVHVQHSRLHV